jgi:hypothetical protein
VNEAVLPKALQGLVNGRVGAADCIRDGTDCGIKAARRIVHRGIEELEDLDADFAQVAIARPGLDLAPLGSSADFELLRCFEQRSRPAFATAHRATVDRLPDAIFDLADGVAVAPDRLAGAGAVAAVEASAGVTAWRNARK